MIAQANSFKMPLADNSVHCAITSVPYFGLRDYGLKPLVFGGRGDCRHEWITGTRNRGNGGERIYGSYDDGVGRGPAVSLPQSVFCRHCNAWLGSYGLEPTIGLFVQHTVEVCREIKRVLRPDGVFWLNIGDSFATGKNGRSAADGKALGNDDRTFRDKPFSITEVPAKNLCLIPQRVVIALQDDGWIVRSAPPWVKRNPMPESVGDRPGTGHEYIYMLVKSARYWWDGEAVRRGYTGLGEPRPFAKRGNDDRNDTGRIYEAKNNGGRALRTSDFFFDSLDDAIAHLTAIRDSGGLLLDSDGGPGAFVVNPKGFVGAHYATFPLALVTPMVLASAPDKCCPKCGKGWVRVVEREANGGGWKKDDGRAKNNGILKRPSRAYCADVPAQTTTLGFRPGCACMREAAPNFGMRGDELLELIDEKAREFAPVPGIVLDPFCGSGTVGQAARKLGRHFIGLDLSPKYLQENALPRAEKLTSTAVLATLPLFADMEF